MLAVLILLMIFAPNTFEAESQKSNTGGYYLGDTNNDREINIKDATEIKKHIANLIILSEAAVSAADVNGDGKVNIKDATDIQKYIAKVSVNSSIGKENEYQSISASTISTAESTASDPEETETDVKEATYTTAVTATTAIAVTQPTILNTKPLESTDAVESTTEFDDNYNNVDDLWFWIVTAEGYLAPGNNHIDETALALQSEIDKAKELYSSSAVIYEEIVSQIKALQNAIEGLKEPNLDRSELWAEIERGIEIAEKGNFTKESYKQYTTAYSKAIGTYHYGDTQDEVDNAKLQLETAINSLVPVTNINFTVAEEIRINGYNSTETQLHLIKSRADMQAVISKIEDYEYSGLYTTPTINDKYDDEFFEHNSLIISLNVVGGSCCSQTLDSITRDGDTLTVHRTIYKPELVLCDMNYQYVLIELSADNTKGINSLADDTIIAKKGEDTTDPQSETITVYFSNSLYWSKVNIHFWGGEYSTSWPGAEMEYVECNIYGQDVYRFIIPADTTGIVFNEGVNMRQTVDIISDITDGYGFYPTDYENGKWKTESYVYEYKEPISTGVTATDATEAETQPDTSETTPDKPIGKENEISFNLAQLCRVESYNNASCDTELYLIRTVAEFDAVLSKIEGNNLSGLYTKPVRDEKYNDEYFMSDALIVSLNVVGGSCCKQTIDSVTVGNNTLTVHRTLYKPEIVLCDMNYQYALIEVSGADINGVTRLKNHNTYITVY